MPFDFDFGKLGETLQGKFAEAKDSVMSYFDDKKPVKSQPSKAAPAAKPSGKPRAQRPKLNPLQEKIYASMQQWTPTTYQNYGEYTKGNMDTNTGNFNTPVPLKSEGELFDLTQRAGNMKASEKAKLGCDRRDNACATAVSLLTRQIDSDIPGHTWTNQLYTQLKNNPKYNTHTFNNMDDADMVKKLNVLSTPGTYAPGFVSTPRPGSVEGGNHAYALFNSGDSLHRFEDGDQMAPMQRFAVGQNVVLSLRNLMAKGYSYEDAISKLNVNDSVRKFLDKIYTSAPVLHTRRWN